MEPKQPFDTETQKHRGQHSPFAPRRLSDEEADDLIEAVIKCAITVQRELGGPGLLEKFYEEALCLELRQQGFLCRQQLLLPVVYRQTTLSAPFRIDLVVEDALIIECKSTTTPNPIFEAQVLTYLRLSTIRYGLLLNFGMTPVARHLKRIVNGY